ELASIWGWRRFRLGLAPRGRGPGAVQAASFAMIAANFASISRRSNSWGGRRAAKAASARRSASPDSSGAAEQTARASSIAVAVENQIEPCVEDGLGALLVGTAKGLHRHVVAHDQAVVTDLAAHDVA